MAEEMIIVGLRGIKEIFEMVFGRIVGFGW
jgi:hypothetical protein